MARTCVYISIMNIRHMSPMKQVCTMPHTQVVHAQAIHHIENEEQNIDIFKEGVLLTLLNF